MEKGDKINKELIIKFLSGKRLSEEEFDLLDKFFNDTNYYPEISGWLEKNWQHSMSANVNTKFEEIRIKARASSEKARKNRLFIVLSKAAAILFIPLLAAALYFYQSYSHELLTIATQKGEQTSIVLPDGSAVWLNVDSKLSYPVDYGIKNRSLNLEGEAYFEVEKNRKLPFEVTSADITTIALGTRFIVSAYPESPVIKASLLEGSVKVKLTQGKGLKILKPGQQLNLFKEESRYAINSFNIDYELGWKNDELVFRLAPFDDVITKLEKWYNIDIEYNEASFSSETLTVRFEKYETLENVLKVISKANGFAYSIEDKYVKIMRK